MDDFFKRGPFGEIIPPALVSGVTPEAAVERLAAAVKAESGQEMEQPRSGRSGEGLLRIAAAYIHAQNLLEALRGELWTPDAIALRVFVAQGGEPVSLRPLYLDDIHFQTFVPVFQREGDDDTQWRIGIVGKGKTRVIPGECGEAFAKAQIIYAQWAKDEEEKVAAHLKQKTSGMATNVFILHWQLPLKETGRADIQDGYCLEHWGTHSTYVLTTPRGIYVLRASSEELAAKYAYVLVGKRLEKPPSPQQVLETVMPRIATPQREGSDWRIGDAVVSFQAQGRATMRCRGDSYDIDPQNNLVIVKKNGRKFRQFEFPANGEWADAKERRRVLLAWCGLLTAEG